MTSLLRAAGMLTGAGAALGVGLVAAARVEAEAFILRRAEAPVLEPGQRPIRILHLSDLHLSAGDRRRIEWTRGLDALEPDLVVNTGDNLGRPNGLDAVSEALGPLLKRPGVFVFGSNDYYGARPKNPAAYLAGPSVVRGKRVPLPTRELAERFSSAGWLNLNNRRDTLEVVGQPLRLVGMDDPHIDKDDMPTPDAAPVTGELRVGVVHAPYLRALNALHHDRSELILAGHTHGGQICLPGTALVTNCDLPRRYAKGLHQWAPPNSADPSFLHVSAGLGTSPYARIRLFCRPEATLLTLTPR